MRQGTTAFTVAYLAGMVLIGVVIVLVVHPVYLRILLGAIIGITCAWLTDRYYYASGYPASRSGTQGQGACPCQSETHLDGPLKKP